MGERIEELEKGLAWLRSHAWGKGAYVKEGKFCGMGALYVANGWLTEDGSSWRVPEKVYYRNDAEELLHESVPPSWGGLQQYNDDKDTTFSDVEQVYLRAINRAEELENATVAEDAD